MWMYGRGRDQKTHTCMYSNHDPYPTGFQYYFNAYLHKTITNIMK